jgi:hypothetical protein
MALIFLLHRLFFRIADFFHHWYVDGSRTFKKWLSSVEQFFKKYGVLGHFGYILSAAALGLAYFVWLLAPIFIIYMIFWTR